MSYMINRSVAVIAAMVLIAIIFAGMVSSVTFNYQSGTQGDERKPVGPPVGKEPPAPPEKCPDDFVDTMGTALGSGTNLNSVQALGIASAECQFELLTKTIAQKNEASAANAECTAVPGCQLHYIVDLAKKCNGSVYKNCVPDSGDYSDPNTTWTCMVHGAAPDYRNYYCFRPDEGGGEE
jgi:hypothetical protein